MPLPHSPLPTVTPEFRERMRNPVKIGIALPNPAAAATTLVAVGLAATRVASSPAGGALVVRAGQMGEAAVRSTVDIGQKVAIQVAGRVRIPDGLLNKVMTEIKNVGSLSYTQQLRDFVNYASQHGLRFDLWVRSNSQLSGPLVQEVANGVINLRTIP